MGYLSGWSWYKIISLTGQTGAGTLYQVELDIGASTGGDFHLENHCTNFPQDIEVTDNDGTTLLDFWIEDTSADPIKMWVEVADDLGSNQSIWVYYGKSGASTNSDIGATFIFGDDFPGTSLDTNKWDGDTGSVTVSGGIATLTGQAKRLHGKPNPSIPYIAESRYKLQDKSVVNQITGISASAGEVNLVGYYTHSGTVDIQNYVNSSSTIKEVGVEANLDNYEIRKTVHVSSSDAKMYYDNTLELAMTTNIPSVGMNHYYRSITVPTTSNVLIDWAFIRKYNDPEPAFSSAGAEQSALGNPYWYYNMLRRRN